MIIQQVVRKTGMRVDAQSYAAIEKLATATTQSWLPSLGSTAPRPGLNLFERLHQLAPTDTSRWAFRCAVFDDNGRTEGRTSFAPPNFIEIALSESTYELLEDDDPRSLFTLYHEIGHATLHRALLLELSVIPHEERAMLRASPPTHKDYEDSEWQANVFASAMLMPAKGLMALERHHEYLSPQVVADAFGVSYRAAEVRLDVFRKRRHQLL